MHPTGAWGPTLAGKPVEVGSPLQWAMGQSTKPRWVILSFEVWWNMTRRGGAVCEPEEDP